MKKKVIIIGAGPAGLTAAYELLKNNKKFDVIILEESNVIGGISKTVNYKGNRMDIGGHRFFSKNEKIMNWWKDIMDVQGFPSFDDKILNRKKDYILNGSDPEKNDKVFLIRDRVSRIFYNNKFFDYPVSMKYETIKNIGFFKMFEVSFSYIKACCFKRKEKSLEDFYVNRFGKKLYSMFFENYTEKVWGRPPSYISPDWGVQRVRGLSIISMIKDIFYKLFHMKNNKKETSLIESFIYPKYGPGQLWELVADEITKLGGKIIKNHKVVKIKKRNNQIESVMCDYNGEIVEINGDIFLSSMPLKDLILGLNDKNKKVNFVANGLPYRDFITVGVLLNKINLKNKTNIKTINNIIPDCWLYIQDNRVNLGRIQIFNNWSPYMVKDINNYVWIGLEYFCNENDNFWNLTDKELKSKVVEELLLLNIIKNDSDVKDYHIERVKKAYPAYFDTYKDIEILRNYINKFDNLLCIGRNGQHRYNNMDHSMLTAIYAVDYINGKIKNKNKIWDINAEKDFHEIKK